MSKRHYVEIADMLRSCRGMSGKAMLQYITIKLGVILEKDNPRFNSEKFEDAVYKEDNK